MAPFERRRSPRASLATRAIVLRSNETLGSFEVLNLGAGGLLLGGERPGSLEEPLQVVLPLGGEEPLVLPGRIVRDRPTRHGPTFVFEFTSVPEEMRSDIDRKIAENVAAAQNARVLVVDDSREIGNALRMQLAWLGHPAHAVTTPLEALRVLEEPNRVEVAIVDLVLGGADGLELIAFLAEQHPEVRRVLMTGHAQPGHLEHEVRNGRSALPHDVLGKPWSQSTLARAVGA